MVGKSHRHNGRPPSALRMKLGCRIALCLPLLLVAAILPGCSCRYTLSVHSKPSEPDAADVRQVEAVE